MKPISLERLTSLVRANRFVFTVTMLVLALVTWSSIAGAAWMARTVFTGLPDNAALQAVGAMPQATTLLDVNDRHAFTIFREQRLEVPLSRVSPHLIAALVAIEDQRFYRHGGVDVVRVMGAALQNLREGRAAQGGSTLTQQLARQSFLTPDKTISRKLREVVVATRLEREFSKDEILELYLNKVYFGDGLYGIEAASLGFFGKPASDLDVPEAALLAGLVKSPSTYAPTINLDRATSRRNIVLQAMRSSGAIDEPTYASAVASPVVLNDLLRGEEGYGQYFKEEVRQELVARFGWERVSQGGLRVFTTIDLDMQKAAEAEVMRALEDIEKRQGRRRNPDGEPLQAALVALDPATGDVRAMVGGRDFSQSSFNRSMQARRQPGSSFKPFVYAAALEAGFSPATVLTGLDEPIPTLDGDWVPEDEHSESPTMSVRTALRTSSNRAAVRMLQWVGIPETVSYAKRMGVGAVPPVPSLALGSGEVTLLSMTTAYAAFANGGLLPTPTLIRRVETAEGDLLFDGAVEPERVMEESTAFLMASLLADVVNAGTAWQARNVGFRLPAGGKTGTTNDYHDAWFVGFTPHLATGVWIGYDTPRPIIGNGYAGTTVVPLWGRFMAAATKGDEADWLEQPDTVNGVTICRLSGRLATDACRGAHDEGGASMVYTEYFAHGTEPLDFCPLHGRSLFRFFAGGTSGMSDPAPPPAAAPAPAAAEPAPVVEVAAAPPAAPEVKPEPEKKRGFWGRLFGGGRRRTEPAAQQ